MIDLSKVPIEDLKKELERRKGEVPSQVQNPDFTEVVRECARYVQVVAEPETDDSPCVDDIEHAIFEEAISAVYGEDVWNWINERL